MRRWPALGAALPAVVILSVTAAAGTIETDFLEQPWPQQSTRTFEIDKYEVRWRQRVDRNEGLFIGVQFNAPSTPGVTWRLATTNYGDIGAMTPGVTAVQYLEQTPTRQVIQIDIKVLWKSLRLIFEVEQEPPRAVRFRLVNEVLGEYRGLLLLQDPPPQTDGVAPASTPVLLATWLKPSRPVPLRLLLVAERIIFLQGVREFLKTCEQQ